MRASRRVIPLVPGGAEGRLGLVRAGASGVLQPVNVQAMKFIIGIVFGICYAILVGLALNHSAGAWQVGNADLGFWWAVIGTILAVAGSGAVLGTWIHTRPSED